MRHFSFVIALVLTFLTRPGHAVALEQDLDYSLYDNILQSYVNASGLVDYMGLRSNSLADLQAVVDQFAKASGLFCS